VLDLVHLGVGLDGHTSSLVPGDPVLDVNASDRRHIRGGPGRLVSLGFGGRWTRFAIDWFQRFNVSTRNAGDF